MAAGLFLANAPNAAVSTAPTLIRHCPAPGRLRQPANGHLLVTIQTVGDLAEGGEFERPAENLLDDRRQLAIAVVLGLLHRTHAAEHRAREYR